jgi:hypothetical protein
MHRRGGNPVLLQQAILASKRTLLLDQYELPHRHLACRKDFAYQLPQSTAKAFECFRQHRREDCSNHSQLQTPPGSPSAVNNLRGGGRHGRVPPHLFLPTLASRRGTTRLAGRRSNSACPAPGHLRVHSHATQPLPLLLS